MSIKNKTADELLSRAYSLQTDDETRDLYRDWAETYDETMLDGLGYLTPVETARVLSGFLPDTSSNILDVGCGTGLAGIELAKLGYINLDALDYSAEMLTVAAKRGIYNDLHEINLAQLIPLQSESYNAMICTGTFTHAHVGASCLDELFRILRTGGLFACTVHKDVWKPAGFEDKIHALEEAGVLVTRYQKPGMYYENSIEPEGTYLVWEKLK